MKSQKNALAALVGAFSFAVAKSAVILESRCALELIVTRKTAGANTIEGLSQIEREAEAYFTELIKFEEQPRTDLTTLLKVALSVNGDKWTADDTITLNAMVSMVYRSDTGRPLLLDTFLDDFVAKSSVVDHLVFDGYNLVSMAFDPVKDDSKILFVEDSDSSAKSGTDRGLIVATSMLSVILIIVSSVLLYITGGWDICQQAITNCLFEEVEEDDEHYLARSKSTFQVQSSETDNGEGEEEDEEAVFETVSYNETEDEESSIREPQMTPSGNLGAMPVTRGLGIKTPNSGITDLTPDASMMTEVNGNPLGITSMRKMPQNETPAVHGGLSHLIMKRLNSDK